MDRTGIIHHIKQVTDQNRTDMHAVLYGVGVGPGDPELMTLKACRLIRENDVIAVPGRNPRESTAYQIAVQAVPSLADKTLVPVDMPMVRDREELRRYHEAGARQLEKWLDQGKNVVFLTLGDPSIYSTFSYLSEIVTADGYPTELVSGIPSFCAAAARLNIPLTEGSESLHIIPASRHMKKTGPTKPEATKPEATKPETTKRDTINSEIMKAETPEVSATVSNQSEIGTSLTFDRPGNYVLMKSGSRMAELKQAIRQSGRTAAAVENCGMPDEKVYRSVDELPDESGYFSIVIVR
jgi:precorrin-2/cobalt-factor-2 C20-methyltransferase